jgi:hypothetical protein
MGRARSINDRREGHKRIGRKIRRKDRTQNPWRGWEDNIKWILQKQNARVWTGLMRRALENTVINLQVTYKAGSFLNSCERLKKSFAQWSYSVPLEHAEH